MSVAYIGNNSRTERPRKTKIGTQVANVTRDSDTTFKVKGQGHQAVLLAAAFTHRQRSACEHIQRGKLLLRCRLQARRSARRREVLRRPHGEERGGAYRVAMRTACFLNNSVVHQPIFTRFGMQHPDGVCYKGGQIINVCDASSQDVASQIMPPSP